MFDHLSAETEVRQAPSLVAYDPNEVVVAVGPRDRKPDDRPRYSTQAALHETTDALGPVVGP